MKLAEKHMDIQNPVSDFPFYVLVETHGSVDSHDQEKLEGFLETAMTEGYVGDGIVAQDQTQFSKIWVRQQLRHRHGTPPRAILRRVV